MKIGIIYRRNSGWTVVLKNGLVQGCTFGCSGECGHVEGRQIDTDMYAVLTAFNLWVCG
jgi:hypothetical protein